jgi:hypothetical protein
MIAPYRFLTIHLPSRGPRIAALAWGLLTVVVAASWALLGLWWFAFLALPALAYLPPLACLALGILSALRAQNPSAVPRKWLLVMFVVTSLELVGWVGFLLVMHSTMEVIT